MLSSSSHLAQWGEQAGTPSPHLSNQAPSWLMVSEESLYCAGVIRPYEDAAPGSTLGESTVVSNVRTARAVFARIELTFKGAFSRKKGPKPHRMWPLLLLHALMRCGVTTLTAQISGVVARIHGPASGSHPTTVRWPL